MSSVVEDLTNVLMRSPTVHEIAERGGMSAEDVIESLEVLRTLQPLSFESMRGEDDGGWEIAMDDRGFDAADDRSELRRLMRYLSGRERDILALRFFEQFSQAEIGDLLGISQMHVSRLLSRSLATLRDLAGHSL